MRRRLFTLASLASLLLCVPVLLIWVRSYSGQDRLERRRYEPSRERRVETIILTSQGSVYFQHGYERCLPVSFIYLLSDDHLQPAGDISLPWGHEWGDLKGTHFFLEPDAHNFLETLGFFSNSISRTVPSRLGTISITDHTTTIRVRFWLILLLLLLLPGYTAAACIRRALTRWQRRRNNTCPGCGYDLTGSTSGVCSECGASVAACSQDQ